MSAKATFFVDKGRKNIYYQRTSQAPSPESNPNLPLPVIAMVDQYSTIRADRAETWMIHRRQSHAIRKVIMNHQYATEVGWFISNKYYPSRELDIDARISSRITTGIRVVRDYQINYNWYNEPFAASP